jgi:2'-hydroxyisoflavone reductase
MNILLLGGPYFLGRHLIDAALAGGHEVTMFNRGRTNTELYPEVERLVGDRNGDLEALHGRAWDAVVDTTGFAPRTVRAACELLAGSVGTYVFVSTTGVYSETARVGCDETSRLRQLADETDDLETEDDVKHYGALKVLCEQEVEAAFPGSAVLLRPGPIVGPHDPTDRFTYWVRRAAAGGPAIVPGPPDRLVQHIDARDLMRIAVETAERGPYGPFNIGSAPYTFEHFLDACTAVAGAEVEWVWADEDWLLEQGVQAPWELPVWLPGAINQGRLACDPSKALAAGFALRPLEETVRDTLEWDAARPRPLHRGQVGNRYHVIPVEPEREAELVRNWRVTHVIDTSISPS